MTKIYLAGFSEITQLAYARLAPVVYRRLANLVRVRGFSKEVGVEELNVKVRGGLTTLNLKCFERREGIVD